MQAGPIALGGGADELSPIEPLSDLTRQLPEAIRAITRVFSWQQATILGVEDEQEPVDEDEGVSADLL
jgi:hypothetical protein